MDVSVLLTEDIYGGALPEGAEGKILKYKVTDLDEAEDRSTLAYSAQAIKNN